MHTTLLTTVEIVCIFAQKRTVEEPYDSLARAFRKNCFPSTPDMGEPSAAPPACAPAGRPR